LIELQGTGVYLLLAAALLGLVIGAGITWLHLQREIQQLRIDKARLETEMEGRRRQFEAQLGQLSDARKTLARHFAVLSRQALKENSHLFLRLAGENLNLHRERASADLRERQTAIDNLVAPIRDTLERARAELREIEQKREASFGSLSEQLRLLAESEQHLRQQTSHLVNALKRSDVRGRWGEMTLKRLVELAGMVEHCDFSEQVSVQSDDGALRPDMIVHMPGQGQLVIDAKAPLDAYLRAVDADDESTRLREMKRHAANLRERVRSLASKRYWSQFSRSPDFVVLFVPGDPFLGSALAADAELMEFAMQRNIVLATPSSLMALLRAVAHGWKQAAFSENAERIRETGEELYRRISTFTAHFQRLGKSLNSSVEYFNKTLGSLERQLLPGARRMSELGVRPARELADLTPLDQRARQPGISADEPESKEKS